VEVQANPNVQNLKKQKRKRGQWGILAHQVKGEILLWLGKKGLDIDGKFVGDPRPVVKERRKLLTASLGKGPRRTYDPVKKGGWSTLMGGNPGKERTHGKEFGNFRDEKADWNSDLQKTT